MVIISLTEKQAERLLELLRDTDDKGPRDEGWKSPCLEEIVNSVSRAIKNHIMPSSTQGDLDG